MLRLALILFPFVATTMMGIGVTAVLSLDMVALGTISIAAAIGFILSIPVCVLLARHILSRKEAGEAPK